MHEIREKDHSTLRLVSLVRCSNLRTQQLLSPLKLHINEKERCNFKGLSNRKATVFEIVVKNRFFLRKDSQNLHAAKDTG